MLEGVAASGPEPVESFLDNDDFAVIREENDRDTARVNVAATPDCRQAAPPDVEGETIR